MKRDLLALVCCPEDKANLALKVDDEDEHGEVLVGTLTCKTCKFVYPIQDGIPNLLPPRYHVDGVKGKKA